MLANLLVTMTLSGVVGGLINYLLAEPPASDSQRLRLWWQYVLIGLGASFVVPLFLNTISSPLVTEIVSSDLTAKSASQLLVMAGFCILAAVSSRTFMQSLAAKVLRVAEDAKKQAESAMAKSTTALNNVSLVVEPRAGDLDDIPHTKPIDVVRAAQAFSKGANLEVPAPDSSGFPQHIELTKDEENTLASMVSSDYVFRTLSGLAKATGCDVAHTFEVLQMLKAKELVSESAARDADAPRYRITSLGQKAMWDMQMKHPK